SSSANRSNAWSNAGHIGISLSQSGEDSPHSKVQTKEAKGRTRGPSLCLLVKLKLLLGRRFGGLGFAFLSLVPAVFLLELLDAAGGVHVLHLAREERVAGRADFDGDLLAGAARDELVAAAARHGAFFVLGMDALFHGFTLSRRYGFCDILSEK